MHVILTHEQADLDALASLMGAWLLNQEALPLLPRNINRNGRRFLERFQDKLPFIKIKDLPRENIDQVTLVDTQSLITLKGMQADTKVVVFDHHPKREDLNPNWELHLVSFGANTSQMVTRIQDAQINLTPLQATVLAMGLYEDTGSFTYSSTTAQDLQAASFCRQNGADLDLISEFLYPPLSTQQIKLYDRLMRNIQTYRIDDQIIMAVKGNAMDIQDEFSSVAHKIRDVLNPDALLLLLASQQGIRLVARSTSDRVDVSAIASSMGGGGHKRAASALVRPEQHLDEQEILHYLDQQYDQMVTTLGQYVSPAVTVAGIMSKDPLILTPDTSVGEAHRLMQRYGYEGYPVVSQGRVVGLLNRREVDRALNHGLDLTVESLMAAGEVKITPNTPLETLQNLMGSSGWGQVPVVSPETGEIVGIVTRTDLLKTLTPQADIPSPGKIAQKLEQAVSPARLALLKTLAEEADKINLPIYVVGGFVRDLLLDRPSLDFDIVVEGDAIFFARRLSDRFGGRVLTHHRFGTAKWDIKPIQNELVDDLQPGQSASPSQLPESLDLITARTEFYEQPAALPTIESSSIKMDLHRRDFTINTLALRLDGEHYGKIHDYWGGLSDLHKGKIRVLHALSFVDDATRLLRAVRFEQRFIFQIEPRTLGLMKESLPLINKLTGARLRHEINLILLEPKAPDMLSRLAELGILNTIHPALPWNLAVKKQLSDLDAEDIPQGWDLPAHADHLNLHQTLSYLVWLGHLSEDLVRAIASRLRFKSDLRRLLLGVSKLNLALPSLRKASPSTIVQQLDPAPRLAIYAAYLMTSEENLRNLIRQYLDHWSTVAPHTTGEDLRAIGLRPSPAYGQILKALRDAWLDGEIHTLEDEQVLLSQLIEKIE